MTTGSVRFDFSSTVVLITGGTSGIGFQIAKDFDDAGATVIVTGRDLDKIDAATEGLSTRSRAVAADSGSVADITAVVDSIVASEGRLDVVVSNAASFIPGDIVDIEATSWEQLRQTNVDGFFHLAQKTLPLLELTGGTLIATSSVSGLRGDWGMSIYNASKGAVSLFVQALRLGLGLPRSPSQWHRSIAHKYRAGLKRHRESRVAGCVRVACCAWPHCRGRRHRAGCTLFGF